MSIKAPSALFSELTAIRNEITQTYDRLRSMQSEIDRELSDVYHEIEASRFDVVRGYKFAKKLQSVLQRRRVIKGEFALVQPLYNMFSDNFEATRKTFEKAGYKNADLRKRLNTALSTEDVI